MTIETIRLREIRLELVHPFETSFGRASGRSIVLVEVMSEGVSGWGEVTAGERPFFSEDWAAGAWLILTQFAAPRLIGRELNSATEVAGLFYATGHFRHGVLLAPVTAYGLADLIVEGRRWAALGPFHPSRFANRQKTRRA